jgi:hypothetical protein
VLRVVVALILVVVLQGCAALQSKEVAIACQVADVGTTMYGKHIGAVETNPLVPNNNALLFIKAAIVALLWTQWDKMDDFGRGAATILSCLPVGNNIAAIREQQKINRGSHD